MVSSKTKKVIKFTYAERVLSSFTLIQREHKKHAIHLASLRAQIQKTADARKDKLGPHWKNWVGKAVHRLEEEGILAASEPSGSVVLTANGKKAISAARRSLLLPASENLSAGQEDLLWKHVTQQAAGQPVTPTKRIRTRRADYSSNEEESDDEASYTPRKPKKRARSSLAASVKTNPLAKLTKAELIDRLERTREAERLRAASPLTELEDDESEELMRLKEVLQHKEAEMALIRSELAGARDDRLALTGPMSPDASDITMSSPSRPNPHTRSNLAASVIRTQSGSLIDQLSKQPTPAPTEHAPSEYNDDPFDAQTDFENTTPRSKEAQLIQQAELYKNQLEELKKTTEERHKLSSDQISSLEHIVASRAGELKNLARKLSDIELQLADKQASLSDTESRNSVLQTNLESYETQLAEKDSAISLKSSQLSNLERAKADMEASITQRVSELEQLVRERDQAVASLQTENTQYEQQLSLLQQALRDSELAIATHLVDLQIVKAQNVSLNSSIEKLQHELDSERVSSTVAFQDRTRLEVELCDQRALGVASEEQNQALVRRIEELDGRISEHAAAQVSLEEELARAVADSSDAGERLREAEMTNHNLLPRRAFVTARAAAAALGPQMAALNDALTERIAGARELEEKLSETQREADDLRIQVSALETTTSNVRASLESKTQEVASVEADLAEHIQTNSALASSLEETQQQLAQSQAAKEELQLPPYGFDQLASGEAAKEVLMSELADTSATLRATTEKLKAAESSQSALRREADDAEQRIHQLRIDLDAAAARVCKLEQALRATQAKYDSDIAGVQASRIALEEALASAQGDLKSLVGELGATREDRDNVRARLESDLTRITDSLDAEKLRAESLASQLTDSIGRAQEVEEELQELRVMKAADATTIDGLKKTFATLKAAQMQSLSELDNKVSSNTICLSPAVLMRKIFRSSQRIHLLSPDDELRKFPPDVPELRRVAIGHF
ncbi:hypothetical protein C8J57DRAFT_1716638 [Mycena rebaudengoi]|nr:hypothetical protein C8J57DRAFT_1716638 [Mycena rebaudengoi]